MCGRDRLRLAGRTYWVLPPTPEDRYLAAEAYEDALQEAEEQGLMTGEEALDALRRNRLWTDEDQAQLDGLARDIENLKVDLFRQALNTHEAEMGRRALARAREVHSSLLCRRHSNDHQTAPGFASLVKARHLMGRCLAGADGVRVWSGDEYLDDSTSLLDKAVAAHGRLKLTEPQARELARTEPWRSIWACRHSEGSVFGVPSAHLTDDQRSLTVWSRLYDNAHEDPECPPEDVVADDDLFDGWMILRRRERDAEVKKKRAEAGLTNRKIAESGEVFVANAAPGAAFATHSRADLEAIESLNDTQAAGIKRERMAAIRRQGSVQEANMPDSKRDIARQMQERFLQQARGK